MAEEQLLVRFKGDVGELKSASDQASAALEKVGKTASAASYLARDAINDMSHELRDLPYALNNPAMLAGPFGKIQALFFDLKQQTGSVQGAFKALGASLMGGGGLLLAGNLLVSAFAILGPKIFASGEDAKNAGEKFNNLKKAMEDYASSLSPLNQALLKGTQNSEEEVLKLDILYKATQNTTLSVKERKKASEELRDMFPSLFKAMSDETIMNGQAKKSYDELRKTLLETARAQALFEEAVDLSKQSDAAAAKRKQTLAELQKMEDDYNKSPRSDYDLVRLAAMADKHKQLNKDAQNYLDINSQLYEIEQKIDQHPSAIVKPHFKQVKLDKEQFEKRVREAIVNDGIDKALSKVLTEEAFKEGFDIDFKPNQEWQHLFALQIAHISTEFNAFTGENAPKFHIPIVVGFAKTTSTGGLDKEQIKELATLVNNTLTPAFESLFTAIESGKAPLQAFFQSVAQSIEQLIARLASAAIAAFAISALSGGSTTFAAQFSSLSGLSFGKHASGGIAYGPSLGMIGEYANAGSNPEVIAPLSKLKSLLGNVGGASHLESRVEGVDIILSQNRTNKFLRRTT